MMIERRNRRAEIAALKRRRLIIGRAHERRHPSPLPAAAAPTPRAPAIVPTATARASAIDPTFPVYATPTTVTVRNNFAAAKSEIEELQDEKLDLSGGIMTGWIVFRADQPIDGGTF
jgi:hypothetical protein